MTNFVGVVLGQYSLQKFILLSTVEAKFIIATKRMQEDTLYEEVCQGVGIEAKGF